MNNLKTFFGNNEANAFCKKLYDNGAEDIELSCKKDGFGQTVYMVKWNFWD